MKKKSLFLLTLVFAFGLVLGGGLFQVGEAQAKSEAQDDILGLNYVADSDLSNEDPRTIIGRIIGVAFGLLGAIFVIIILYGGFKWMTAGGNPDNTTKARQIIFSGIIGLAIILMAWAITNFVIGSLKDATDSSGRQKFPDLK
ncbi:pilin [Patescibacteria group bacterium]|nr:pilin [Patescibacteria group bacterium]